MTSPIGFPPGTVYDIIEITNSRPGVVTLSSVNLPGSFYLVNGMTVTISGVNGMGQVNRKRYITANVDNDAMTFQLYHPDYNLVDTTNYTPYTSGGQINIVSYPPQAGQPPGLMYNTQPITI